MSAYVVLTAFLFQRGSAESMDPDDPSPQDEDPAHGQRTSDAPMAVRMRACRERSIRIRWALHYFCSS